MRRMVAQKVQWQREARLEELVNIPQNNSKVHIKGRIAELTKEQQS